MTWFAVTIENRAWPYDYGPREVLTEATDREDAMRKALAHDNLAEVKTVKETDAP